MRLFVIDSHAGHLPVFEGDRLLSILGQVVDPPANFMLFE